MDYANILEFLNKDYRIESISKALDTEILDIALIDSKCMTPNKTTLYFGYDKQIVNMDLIPYNCILAKTGSFQIPENFCGKFSDLLKVSTII